MNSLAYEWSTRLHTAKMPSLDSRGRLILRARLREREGEFVRGRIGQRSKQLSIESAVLGLSVLSMEISHVSCRVRSRGSWSREITPCACPGSVCQYFTLSLGA